MIIYIAARDIYILPSRSQREGYAEYIYGVLKRRDAFENQFFRFGPFPSFLSFPPSFVIPRFSRATPRDTQIRKRAQDYSLISITRSCDILHKTLGYFSPFGRQCSCGELRCVREIISGHLEMEIRLRLPAAYLRPQK